MTDKQAALTEKMFILGGLINLGVSIAFVLPNNLATLYPMVFEPFGMIAIMLWGLAYISVSSSYTKVRPLLLVFTLEKAIYAGSWIYWLVVHRSEIDPETKFELLDNAIYSYGLIDLTWGVFFAWVFFATAQPSAKPDDE